MGGASRSLNNFADRLFTAYAEFAVKRALLLCLVGVVIGIVFSLGLLVAKVENRDINALWVDLDSRVDDERKTFEEFFGGDSRRVSVMISGAALGSGDPLFNTNDNEIRNVNALDAMRDAMLVAANLNFTYEGKTYTRRDVCERPVVPAALLPTSSSAILYTKYSQCMANVTEFTALLLPGVSAQYPAVSSMYTPLPTNWGVTELPCARASSLDCFQEGQEVDYPESLQQLGSVAGPLAIAARTTFANLEAQVANSEVSIPAGGNNVVNFTVRAITSSGAILPCWFISPSANFSCLSPLVNLSAPDAVRTAVTAGRDQIINLFNTLSPGSGSQVAQAFSAVDPLLIASPTGLPQYLQAAATIRSIAVGLLKASAPQNALLGMLVTYIDLSDFLILTPGMAQVPIGAGCISTAITEFVRDAGAHPVIAETELRTAILFFSSLGYWWRPSFRRMTQAQIVEHINLAANAELNPAVRADSSQCIVNPNVRCCQTWNGAFIGTAVTYAGKAKASGRPVDATNFTSLDLETITLLQNGWEDYHPNNPLWQDQLELLYSSTSWTSEKRREGLATAFDDALTAQWLNRHNKEEGTGFEASGNYSSFRLDFSTGVSFADLLEDGSRLEGSLVGLSYGLMVVLVITQLGSYIPALVRIKDTTSMQLFFVNSYGSLGLYGLLVIALGSIAGIGFASYVQITLNALTINLVPFVSLGLGIDDMFVLAHTMISLNDRARSVESNMAEVLRLAGPSVCLTSFANAMAFLLIYYIPIAAVRQLVLVLMISVLINLIFLFLIFVPLMIWDLRRNHANRYDLIYIKSSKVTKTTVCGDKYGTPILDVFIDKVYAPFLSNKIVKLIVIVCFCIFFGWALWNGIVNTEQGLRTSDIALKNSYQRDLAVLAEAEFPIQRAHLLTRALGYNFSDPRAQQIILNALDNLDESPWRLPGLRVHDVNFLSNGTASILSYYNRLQSAGALQGCLPANVSYPIQQEACYNIFFQRWYNDVGSGLYPYLYCRNTSGLRVSCGAPGAVLIAARSGYYLGPLHTHENFLSAITDLRERTDQYSNTNVSSFSVGFIFSFWEQYFGIETTLIAVSD